MRSILILSLFVVSLFPACKRNNEHTQSSAMSTKLQTKQSRTLPDDTCEPVDRSNLHKGIACLVAAPATAAVGTGATFLLLLGSVGTFGIPTGHGMVGCISPIIPLWFGFPLAIGVFAATIVGTGILFTKACTYLSAHARAVKARERARCNSRKKIHTKEGIALAA